MSRPRTEAGRRLLDLLHAADAGPLADTLAADWEGGIERIEAEAAAAERARLVRAVESMDTGNSYFQQADGHLVVLVEKADVLALLDAEPERQP